MDLSAAAAGRVSQKPVQGSHRGDDQIAARLQHPGSVGRHRLSAGDLHHVIRAILQQLLKRPVSLKSLPLYGLPDQIHAKLPDAGHPVNPVQLLPDPPCEDFPQGSVADHCNSLLSHRFLHNFFYAYCNSSDRSRSIGYPSDVKNGAGSRLQASLTRLPAPFSPPSELSLQIPKLFLNTAFSH